MANVARDIIKEHHMEDRVDVPAGDYNRDPIGEGHRRFHASCRVHVGGWTDARCAHGSHGSRDRPEGRDGLGNEYVLSRFARTTL
ncbi:hypothetical protein KAW64_06985 [bacterium]|nr:hypothetical protein [bacterium]